MSDHAADMKSISEVRKISLQLYTNTFISRRVIITLRLIPLHLRVLLDRARESPGHHGT